MANKKSSGVLKWIILLLVLGGGGYFGWNYYSKRAKEGPAEFKTATVAKGDITQSVTANGALNPVRTVTVGSQISGIITELKVDFNSRVKQGDVLAKIDPATYERALARAEADQSNAQAGLELAKFNAKRAKQLYAEKLISESEYEQADIAMQQAEANVKIRQAAVDTAKVDLDRTTIYAPISGIVISRKVDAGQTVAASFNTPELFTIANDLTKMQIDTLVSEADVGGVQEGQKVNFTVDAFPGRKFNGFVNQVRFAPITNQNVVNYTAVVEVDNRDLRLRPGMTANASLITAQRTNALVIQNAALRFRPPESVVVATTNDAVAKAAGVNDPAKKSGKTAELATSGPFAGLPIPPWQAGGERRRPTDQERADYEATLTPEQKEKYQQVVAEMRARFAQMAQGGGGGGFGGGGPGGGGGSRSSSNQNEGPAIRTVYVLDKEKSTPDRPVLQAVSVKTGIADGSNTEIQDGLKEGDVVITGLKTTTTTATTTPTANPFGPTFGGPRR
ncbi:MAG: efflux RND transporter periplasmic adaptor subunit [Verrucomicrobia bacterium]|nr:efflux RND transporter periplasmic adaptor subunit [Verrucomicrobiota bacterium]